MNKSGYFPYTPNTNLLYGLAEACDMLLGRAGRLDGVFARHQRWGEGVRAAVQGVGPGDPVRGSGRLFAGAHRRRSRPQGVDADAVRKMIYERFDLSLGTGPGQGEGPHVPHRPPRRLQRSDADGDAGRRARWD